MNIYLTSYSTHSFLLSQKRLEKSAHKFGITKFIPFNYLWLKWFEKEFYLKNQKHFQNKKGGGLWVWKPFIILKALEKLNEGDILIYLDSGIEIVKPLTPLLNLVKQKDIILFSTFTYKNEFWTKAETFEFMNCHSKKYKEIFQFEGGMIFLKKTKCNIYFIQEWLNYCENYDIINDDTKVKQNRSFNLHRHDQSILTNLAIKYNIEPYRSPHQFTNNFKPTNFRKIGEYLDRGKHLPKYMTGKYVSDQYVPHNSKYDTLLNLHRDSGYKKYLLPRVYLQMFINVLKVFLWLKK